MRRAAAVSAIVLAWASSGCGSTGTAAAPGTPAAPSAAPAAAAPEAPPAAPAVATLSLEPGARHAFRHRAKWKMRFPDQETLGTIDMEVGADAIHTVLSVDAPGCGCVETVLGRVQGFISMPSMGMRMEIDSDNEALVQSAKKGGPFAPFQSLLGSVGVPQRWTLARRAFPVPDSGEEGTPRKGRRFAGPGDGTDLFAVMIPLTWMDLLPEAPLTAGGGGSMHGDLSALGAFSAQGLAWSVESWDADEGIVEFSLQDADAKSDTPSLKGAKGESFEVEFRDRFDVRRGRYLTRRMILVGEAAHASAEGPTDMSGFGRLVMEAELIAERLPDPPPAGAEAPGR